MLLGKMCVGRRSPVELLRCAVPEWVEAARLMLSPKSRSAFADGISCRWRVLLRRATTAQGIRSHAFAVGHATIEASGDDDGDDGGKWLATNVEQLWNSVGCFS